MTRGLALGCLVASVLAGCAASAPGVSADDAVGTEGATATGGAGISQVMIDAVVEQAAAETGVDAAEIRVVTAEAVTWSDGSLGCPEPGQAYTQALVPGFRIVLDVGGADQHYHASQTGDFAACADPIEPVENGADDR
jgi:hypothetical protein